MLKSGILNPNLLSLLARIRHTNALVIADRGFPSWPGLETIDLSVVDDLPAMLPVLRAIRSHCTFGQAYMAQEFLVHNSAEIKSRYDEALAGVPVAHEPHVEFKRRVPNAIGLIRTGESVPYSNMILISA